jgi:hypothetical protein
MVDVGSGRLGGGDQREDGEDCEALHRARLRGSGERRDRFRSEPNY